jgi:hypothetical protein
MKPIMDKSILRETKIDSGALGIRSAIIHRIAEPGEYRGTVYRGTAKVGTFALDVVKCATDTTTAGTTIQNQISIDLSTLDSSYGAKEKVCSQSFLLQTEGHSIFFVSTGIREYAVKLSRTEKKKLPVNVFDSQILGKGDIFVTHVMRPGSYSIVNTLGKGHADLTVEYPESGKTVPNMEPVLVECKDNTMNPEVIAIQSVQPLMFSCAQDSRITIELKKAEDRPRPPRIPVSAVALRKGKSRAAGRQKRIIRTIRFYG